MTSETKSSSETEGNAHSLPQTERVVSVERAFRSITLSRTPRVERTTLGTCDCCAVRTIASRQNGHSEGTSCNHSGEGNELRPLRQQLCARVPAPARASRRGVGL